MFLSKQKSGWEAGALCSLGTQVPSVITPAFLTYGFHLCVQHLPAFWPEGREEREELTLLLFHGTAWRLHGSLLRHLPLAEPG